MAKCKRLIEALIETPPAEAWRKPNWIERLRACDPELHADAVKLAERFIAGDREVRSRLPTQTAFCNWLSAQLKAAGHNVARQTCHQLFAFLRGRKDA